MGPEEGKKRRKEHSQGRFQRQSGTQAKPCKSLKKKKKSERMAEGRGEVRELCQLRQ